MGLFRKRTTDPADAEELTEAIRSGLAAHGIDPSSVTTTTTSETIDAADVPGLRDEVLQMLSQGADHQAIAAHTLARLAEHGFEVGGDVAGATVVPGATPAGSAPAAPPPLTTASEPETDPDDPGARLQRLIELRDKGLIGYAEYDTLRAKILDEL